MINARELKQRLEEVVQSDFRAPSEEEAPKLLAAMMAHLGSTDPTLRDDLIYATLARWIIHDRLEENQVRKLLGTLLNERHLFYRIEEKDPEAVFTRSFSVLLLAPILDAHCRHAFLSPQEILSIKDQVARYAAGEADHRGYVEGEGWAHAAAHTADTLDELARCEELGREGLLDLLAAVYRLIADEEQVYRHEEDERLSVAVARIAGRRVLTMEDWKAWLERLVSFVMEPRTFPSRMVARVNVKNLLRSVFFRLRREDGVPGVDPHQTAELIDQVDRALASIAPF